MAAISRGHSSLSFFKIFRELLPMIYLFDRHIYTSSTNSFWSLIQQLLGNPFSCEFSCPPGVTSNDWDLSRVILAVDLAILCFRVVKSDCERNCNSCCIRSGICPNLRNRKDILGKERTSRPKRKEKEKEFEELLRLIGNEDKEEDFFEMIAPLFASSYVDFAVVSLSSLGSLVSDEQRRSLLLRVSYFSVLLLSHVCEFHSDYLVAKASSFEQTYFPKMSRIPRLVSDSSKQLKCFFHNQQTTTFVSIPVALNAEEGCFL
jgi:hypothetical protein